MVAKQLDSVSHNKELQTFTLSATQYCLRKVNHSSFAIAYKANKAKAIPHNTKYYYDNVTKTAYLHCGYCKNAFCTV